MKYFLLLAVIFSVFISCSKEISQTEPEATSRTTTTKPRLSYGDTLFFLRNQPGVYTILPVSRPDTPGYFKSAPMGLALDSVTGRINISQSETGIRYKVYYLSPARQVLDSVKLVISGIDYQDSIYEIQATPVTYDTAFPIYNARPELRLPCSDDDDEDDDSGCVFDETDLDGDGNDDIAGVIQDKLLVDKKKGTIDAEASFHAGIFGSSNPANGLFRDFTFYYRLTDPSNRALNRISVRVFHFKKRTDIPQWLLDEMNKRRGLAGIVNSRTAGNTNSATARTATEYYYDYATMFRPKRPPLIIIVSQ